MKIFENYKKFFKKGDVSNKKPAEELSAADKRLNEYLAEEQKRKKALDAKLLEELQIKKRDETQKKKKSEGTRKIDELIFDRRKHLQKNRAEQEKIQREQDEQRRITEYKIVMERLEQNRCEVKNCEEQNNIENPKTIIDTQFISKQEVNITNIGPGRIQFDKFPGKIGYVPKKRD